MYSHPAIISLSSMVNGNTNSAIKWGVVVGVYTARKLDITNLTIILSIKLTTQECVMLDFSSDVQVCESIDSLLTDTEYTTTQLDILNLEATPEIQAILINHLYKNAIKEMAEFNSRERYYPLDRDILAYVVEIQLKIEAKDEIINKAKETLEGFKEDYAKTGRFTPRHIYTGVSKIMWDAINDKKELIGIVQDFVNDYPEDRSSIWYNYFQIEDKEAWINEYNKERDYLTPNNTWGETEQVDNSTIYIPNLPTTIECIRDTHIEDSNRENEKQSNGPAFWRNSTANYMKSRRPIFINDIHIIEEILNNNK